MFIAKDTLKGTVVGVLACGLLEFGTLVIFAFLKNRHIIHFYDNDVRYYLPLIIVFLVTTLLGIGIARRSRLLKKITLVFTIALTLLVISGFGYAIWYDSNQPPPNLHLFD